MIPDGWKKATLGEHVDLLTGNAFKSAQYTDDLADIRLLRGDNIGQGFLRWRDAKRWPSSEVDQYNRYALRTGDLVIAMDRTWIPAGLKISEVGANDLPCLLVQRVGRVRSKHTLEQRLLIQLLNSFSFEQYVKSVQTETAVPHISPKDIREFSILLPPASEQRRIAEILSTWDQAIEATEKLIANSEAQKKALMQQFLTGKKRLPGFEGEWSRKTLSSLGKTYAGLSGKTKADFGSGKPFVPYKNVFANAELNMSELEYVRLSDGEKQNMVKTGDIIFTTSSETPDEVGMSSAVLTDIDELYLNSFCFGFRIEKQNEFLPIFAKHLFRSSELRRAISSLAQGSTRYNLSKNEFLKIVIHLPKRAEQEQIVEVLDAFETTPDAEQKKLKKLKVEKSALMQQLLTGKRRVAINKKEAVNA